MYQVEFHPSAAQDFEGLDQIVADRVLKKLAWLAANFESIKLEPLTDPLAGLFKLRVGDYRVIYQADREKKRANRSTCGASPRNLRSVSVDTSTSR